jgi:hypothetical protein
MKILLRNYNGKPYVWATAKYNRNDFYVDGSRIPQDNIVSIMNDNRKKYFRCSCCGQVFRKGDRRFKTHKENAIKPETCFDCPHLYLSGTSRVSAKYVVNKDGSFGLIETMNADLRCDNTNSWFYPSIDSCDAICKCDKRRCADATENEISDFFTQYPGAFDDILTIDRLLDENYDVSLGGRNCLRNEIIFNDDNHYVISVYINSIGIVDYFSVRWLGFAWHVYYSKKYDELFVSCDLKYQKWNESLIGDDLRKEIKNQIAKFYR